MSGLQQPRHISTLPIAEVVAFAEQMMNSLAFEVRRLNDGPPFLDLGLLNRAERFRSLLLARRNPIPSSPRPLRTTVRK